MAACPYNARFMLPSHRTYTPITNVVDKCTFCFHRVTQNLVPACVQTCIGRSRVFGDLNDPNSEVSYLVATNATQVLRPEEGTKPHVFYIGADRNQKSFKLSLDQFMAKRGGKAIASKGKTIKKQNAALFQSIEARYGVPAGPLIAIFTADPGVIAVGAEWLRILSFSFFVYGWWMVAVQAFNGAGDTVTPTKINLVFFWLIQIPLSYWLALRLGWQQTGVFWGVFVSETSVGLFTLWLFSRGSWKTAKV